MVCAGALLMTSSERHRAPNGTRVLKAATVKLMRSNHLEGGRTLSDPAFNTHLADTVAGTDRANCIFSPGTGFGLSFSVVLDKEEVVEVDKDGAGIGQCSVGTWAPESTSLFIAPGGALLIPPATSWGLQRWYTCI